LGVEIQITQDVFDEARTEIAGLLETGAVKRFKASKEYSALVSEDLVLSTLS
jgi:hypothetical protein